MRMSTKARFGPAMSMLLVFAGVNAWADDTRRAQVLKVAPSLARVEARIPGGGFAFGTAVAITGDRLVTNCHVTRAAQDVFVISGGLRWRAQAQLADVGHDLCLLWVPGLNARAATLADGSDLHTGLPVTAIGFGGATGIQISTGEVTGLHALDDAHVIRSSAAFSGGASGGGLFDEEGRLHGILCFRLPAKGAYYFSMPVEWFRHRVFELSTYRPVAPLGEEKSFWEQSQARQPYFMRATALEAAQDWSAMLSLADAWMEAEPRNPDSRDYLGKALGASMNANRSRQ